MYKPNKGQSTRVELRTIDPACNPYLAFAVVLRRGHEGHRGGLRAAARGRGRRLVADRARAQGAGDLARCRAASGTPSASPRTPSCWPRRWASTSSTSSSATSAPSGRSTAARSPPSSATGCCRSSEPGRSPMTSAGTYVRKGFVDGSRGGTRDRAARRRRPAADRRARRVGRPRRRARRAAAAGRRPRRAVGGCRAGDARGGRRRRGHRHAAVQRPRREHGARPPPRAPPGAVARADRPHAGQHPPRGVRPARGDADRGRRRPARRRARGRAAGQARPSTRCGWSTAATCCGWPRATSPTTSVSTTPPPRSPTSPAATLDGALAVARARVGEPAHAVRLAVIAMGKCGGHELNYISDVDVIFVHEPVESGPAARTTASPCGRPPSWPRT